ncbi:type 1 glutamine amidotransferase [Methanolobus profundi]|uniref:GMP synthase-Glutamine amidotransferase n=1 Tax=Methanolobus profundi TaxID=487685 RepID=A0A1I4PZC8_9EURY|nr:type 1 glutamine amidotransferase [Methanolobus profundi]SFM33139.1 GMP synthase-Glutamine amidotransferase [Methanolobus profundi]
MTLLIVKNISREGPGILQKILDENRIPHDIVDLDAGDELPEPENHSALIVFGGPDSANDTTEKMTKELEMIGRALDSGIPYLGICLGMQALVKACGGSVHANDVKEIGFRGEDGEPYSIDIDKGYIDDPLFNGLESPLKIFHLHGETVAITEEMQLLATGKYCRHQIVKIGDRAYGIQGHFELTPEMFTTWLDNDPELMEMIREELLKDFKLLEDEYTGTGRKLFTNFLKISGSL